MLGHVDISSLTVLPTSTKYCCINQRQSKPSTLFTPETKQAKYHPDIKIAGSQLPLNRSPKILGVHLDTSLTFNVHCTQAATRVSNRNNVLKALAGTSWGQQKETILMTYKAIGRSVANYGAPVWSTNASVTSIERFKLRRTKP